MNMFQVSLSTVVFASTLLLGTTAVIASRYVITTVAGFTRAAAAASETVLVPASETEKVAKFDDLRNEPQPEFEDFDPSGSLWLDPDKIPNAFADIELLEIATTELSYDRENETYSYIPIIPTGMLQTRVSFAFIKTAVANREISFETVQKNGISYQFVGNFPISLQLTYCQECGHPADLKGRLKKLKNGKVISETDAKFFYVHNC